ncbi:2-amino-4-hydroxy-6-hydroxymethyldihydropteridine diphosphokinase [Flocculibacter collagenilyticus]|uniref:2-amino-4-hydroxy-6- hydroxymethyldihydropteridine diphosphokinase n=1 Tax=Flocculibacter collagenilyticus TaxID=2744479 RepID=UPI0018F66B2E|nr:2-amino-4-hydroxy-6-hydroxymethyldihydropteridine diphosphokinase [Flocculibacter collagenilyticus]
MTTCYIGIGGNLNNPLATVKSAISALSVEPHFQLVAVSAYYQSQPMGPQDQPDYVNAAALIETSLSAEQVLATTQRIEQQHGRVRKDERWGARTLDLDILLYGNSEINTEHLTVPHYGLKEREFVLYPLADITPALILPCGTSLSSLLERVPLNGLTAINA